MALRTVPSPIVSPSGIHSNNSTTPVMIVTWPTARPVSSDDAGVEHVPRRGAEVGVDQQGDADAEDGETDDASPDALDGSIGGHEAMHPGTLTIRPRPVAMAKCRYRAVGSSPEEVHTTGDLSWLRSGNSVTPPRHTEVHDVPDSLCRL